MQDRSSHDKKISGQGAALSDDQRQFVQFTFADYLELFDCTSMNHPGNRGTIKETEYKALIGGQMMAAELPLPRSRLGALAVVQVEYLLLVK